MDNYLVVEFQTNADGTCGSLKYQYSDPSMTQKQRENAAEKKYHEVLAAAAVSSCKIHSAALMDFTGRLIKREQYTHNEEAEAGTSEQ